MSDEEFERDDVVLAATDRPLPIVVSRIEDERVPDGMIGLATFLSDRMIARCAVTPEIAEFIERKGFFDGPVPLVLAGREESPGLQCRLFAVIAVPPDLPEDEGDSAEPWAASAPRYEDLVEQTETEDPEQGMIFLGQIVRFSRDRRHPDDLAMETADVLRALVEGKTNEVVDRALEDLLGEGPSPA